MRMPLDRLDQIDQEHYYSENTKDHVVFQFYGHDHPRNRNQWWEGGLQSSWDDWERGRLDHLERLKHLEVA